MTPLLIGKKPRKNRSSQEIRGFIREFEQTIVDALKIYDIQASGKTPQKTEGALAETAETGVWVGSQKIASLGIAVKKWVTYHGAAINLDHDPEAFQGLNPCGFKPTTMISLETLTGKKIDREIFAKQLSELLVQRL